MRGSVVAGLMGVLLVAGLGAVAAQAATKASAGTMVIVFKDGHRQVVNLADVERVEYPTAEVASVVPGGATATVPGPSRGRFLGKWAVGDGSGHEFFITLMDNGDAQRSIGGVHGRWVYVNGEADITWDDGPEDAIRRMGTRYQKFSYAAGKPFSDVPQNVTGARNTTQKPI